MKYFNFIILFLVMCLIGLCLAEKCSLEEEGHRKRIECGNRCICRNELWLCTRRGCTKRAMIAKRDLPISVDLKNIPCAPNDYFKIDCNTCYCNLEKTGYLCTENLCTDEQIILNGPSTQIPITNASILLIANHTAQIIRHQGDIEANSTFKLPRIDVAQLKDTSRTHPKSFNTTVTSLVASKTNCTAPNLTVTGGDATTNTNITSPKSTLTGSDVTSDTNVTIHNSSIIGTHLDNKTTSGTI